MHQKCLTTGSPDLDTLIGGGLEPGVLTQFYGEPASGKSTVCTLAAVTCIRSGKGVIFIDSEGFSIERFRQVAGTDAEALADQLYLYEPVDFEQQGEMIADADKILRARKAGLVIVDSATAFYRTELEGGREAMQRLTRQTILLLGYARRYGIPVILTNQVYMDTERNTFFGLGGMALEHISKVIVRLQKLEGRRKAILVKHRSRPEGGSFEFVITSEGVRAVG
ncbi:MAG: DNA repair and recombination protein RadB [Methanoregulaceae archaeon]